MWLNGKAQGDRQHPRALRAYFTILRLYCYRAQILPNKVQTEPIQTDCFLFSLTDMVVRRVFSQALVLVGYLFSSFSIWSSSQYEFSNTNSTIYVFIFHPEVTFHFNNAIDRFQSRFWNMKNQRSCSVLDTETGPQDARINFQGNNTDYWINVKILSGDH